MANQETVLVNLTRHDIVVVGEDGQEVLRVPPSGQEARAKASTEVVALLNGIEVAKSTIGDVEGLPEPVEGTVYITSSLVAQKVAGLREDVVSPDTGPTAVRNAAGQIVAVKRFQRF